MNRKLNIALVGCGSIGLRHAEHIISLANLKAVCDIKEERGKTFSNKFGVSNYLSIDKLIEMEKDLDLIAICTPNGLHCMHTVTALNSGINVLCEKPMALSLKECDRMILASEHSNKRLFIIKQNRFNPPIAELKNIIDNKRLGEIYSFQLNCFWNRSAEYYITSDWKGTKKLDGGILFTQYSHFIDLICWFFGNIKKVSSITKNFAHKDIIEFEDSGVCILEFENGILGTINFNVNAYKTNMEGSITVFGEKGSVKIGGQYVNKIEYQNIEGYVMKSMPKIEKANDYGFYRGSMSNHDKVYECVISDILNNTSKCVGAIEGRMTVEAIEQIYEAQI
ncbi:MAG TPA: Gfo/Idh/MocA family oxidoreductase [Ignavibacteria bacterium]